MVETKTTKKKAAAKVAARAAHEIAAVSNLAAKKAKAAAASPAPSAKTPSPAVAKRTRSGVASAVKPAASSSAKASSAIKAKGVAAKKVPFSTDPRDQFTPEPSEDEEEGESEDGDGEEKRLVIKLDKKKEKNLADRLKKVSNPATAQASGESGVVYLGRIPFGFFEKEMRAYFTQFGEVKRLRISRNKKTGNSKHYAFIEFVHPEVAVIVAETHDNMLICDRMVKCNVVPVDKIHETMFIGADEEFKAFPWRKMAKAESNKKRTPQQHENRIKRLGKAETKKRSKLEALGIDYDFKGHIDMIAASKPKKTKFAD